MHRFLTALFLIFLVNSLRAQQDSLPHLVVLGVAQDGGYPHIGCQRVCCTKAWADDSAQQFVVSLALVNPAENKWWLFEATPDITRQLQIFADLTGKSYPYLPDGIFITHAHMGHYTGLMQLGREALGAKGIPVYVLPKMKSFLEQNGPWSQLVNLRNIEIRTMQSDSLVALPGGLNVLPFTVPHRDEYSETAGFRIATPSRKYLFIPDIDKWSKFDRDIIQEVSQVDIALLDATFYTIDELPNRRISEVPHPFVSETMELFELEAPSLKQKIRFIHFNHTNPLMWDEEKREEVQRKGFGVAVQGERL